MNSTFLSRAGTCTLLSCIVLFSVFFHADASPFTKKKKKKNQHANPALMLADKFFAKQDYYMAAHEYAKVVKHDSTHAYAMYNLAECYRLYLDFSKAEKVYKLVADRFRNSYPYARFWYATMLKDNAHYSKAIQEYKRYMREHKDIGMEAELHRQRALLEIKGCEEALASNGKFDESYLFHCLPRPVNSNEHEYASVTVENDSSIFITSSRKGGHGKDNSMGGSLCDLYRFKKTGAHSWTSTHNNHDDFTRLNTPFNESSGTFTADKKKFYFTRCDERTSADNYERYNCAIYVSNFVNGKWTDGVLLNENINPPGQWNSQPCISADGTILVFVSKRPGGIGMHDIWYSSCIAEDNWGPANNLTQVNTLFTEMSPYFAPDQRVLFFSSNGHGGRGAMDIFMVRVDSLDHIINIGTPFNSHRDDFYFTLGEKKGYLTSNREGGVGYDDVYSFDIPGRQDFVWSKDSSLVPAEVIAEIKRKLKLKADTSVVLDAGNQAIMELRTLEICKVQKDSLSERIEGAHVRGTIRDNKGNPVTQGIFIVKDEFDNILKEEPVENGNCDIFIKKTGNKGYVIQYMTVAAATDTFQTNLSVEYRKKPVVDHLDLRNSQSLIATIEPSDEYKSISLEGSLHFEESNLPASGSIVLLADDGSTIKTTKTGSDGKYKFVSLPANKRYQIILQQSPNDQTLPLSASQVEIKGSEQVATRNLFENIYFDFDKYELRPEAKKTLDDLIKFCRENPGVQIELSANTDSYGSPTYNKILAGKRGDEALKYLKENGITESSIVLNAQGESNFIADNESEEGRQRNRRVEFYIRGGKGYETTYITTIAPPDKSLFSLANEYNMTVDELKEANGLTGDELKAYAPLRVRRVRSDVALHEGLAEEYVTDTTNFTAQQREVFKKQQSENASLTADPEYLLLADSSVIRENFTTTELTQEQYEVKPGNTLDGIAHLYGISAEEIKSYNHLDDSKLKENQLLLIDVSKRKSPVGYLVKEGDSLEAIAIQYGLDLNLLKEINKTDGYRIQKNMLLLFPR